MKDPIEKEDWQMAVNLAQALILIDLSKRCGVSKQTDSNCNFQRCEDILKRGKSIGVEPLIGEVDTIIRALAKMPEKLAD